jgi:selenoprotein W-related protein
MSEITIEYCVPCDFLERAETIQHQLLQQFGERIESAALVTGDKGVLRVHVDGDVVWDKDDDEYDLDEITRRVREHV